jgi:hypothetical protein
MAIFIFLLTEIERFLKKNALTGKAGIGSPQHSTISPALLMESHIGRCTIGDTFQHSHFDLTQYV